MHLNNVLDISQAVPLAVAQSCYALVHVLEGLLKTVASLAHAVKRQIPVPLCLEKTCRLPRYRLAMLKRRSAVRALFCLCKAARARGEPPWGGVACRPQSTNSPCVQAAPVRLG